MNVRRIAIGVAIGFSVILFPVLACGQTAREEKTNSLTYRGVPANAQTNPKNHTMNRNPNVPMWGGCVPSSVRTAALHGGIPADRIEYFWRLAQRKVGVNGTSPQLLAEMLNEAMPGEKWISYVGADASVLDKLSAKGYCLGGTMAWGDPALYGNRKIAHMVNVDHYSSNDQLACVEDNNDPPGVYRWMTAKEYAARCFDGGMGWVFAFTRLPAVEQVTWFAVALASALLLLASAMTLAGWAFLRPARLR